MKIEQYYVLVLAVMEAMVMVEKGSLSFKYPASSCIILSGLLESFVLLQTIVVVVFGLAIAAQVWDISHNAETALVIGFTGTSSAYRAGVMER